MNKQNLTLAARVRAGAARLAVAATAAAATVGAHAAAIDVSAIETDIKAQAGPIATVGGAVLLIFLGIKAFRWVKASMGGG